MHNVFTGMYLFIFICIFFSSDHMLLIGPHTVYSPIRHVPPHLHSVMDTVLSLLKPALRLEWPALVKIIDTKAQ
jgi:hypothetical protein